MCRRLLVLIAITTLITACDAVDTMKEGFAHSQAVSDRLQKTIGLPSLVGFNWNNGTLNSVSVTFQGMPREQSLPDIAASAKQAIAAEFKQTPRQIVISFSIEP
ncbi:MAG: hypothetical protein KF778_22070 [Rhodocyclaceae bacterium]|nr:hypothetical protein [Rhodocyclaceae bacterium]MBX3671092.1 hypothetical protein [Rhodocyclaceae bacterium]